MCVCVCVSACVFVARKTHTAELVCVSCASLTLVRSARPCSTPTLGHPPFTLLSLCIFSAGPRSKLECLVPVFFFFFFPFRCRSVFCYLFGETFPRPWGGCVGAREEGRVKGKVWTVAMLPGQEDEGAFAATLSFRNGASCRFLLTTLKFGFMALRRVLPTVIQASRTFSDATLNVFFSGSENVSFIWDAPSGKPM